MRHLNLVGSVGGGLSYFVQDEDVDGGLYAFEFEAELLLDCGEQAGRGVGGGVGRIFKSPLQLEVIAPGEAGAVENGAVDVKLEYLNKVRNGDVEKIFNVTSVALAVFLPVRGGLRVGGRGQERSALDGG